MLAMIRDGRTMSAGQKVRLAVMLSVPAVVAQLSSIVMQYIDASMVGTRLFHLTLVLFSNCLNT